MKTLYIDCTNGVSGDMVLHALSSLAGTEGAELALEPAACDHEGSDALGHCAHHGAHRHKDADHGVHHGRSYAEVRAIIEGQTQVTAKARDIAGNIYQVIARAEAAVHEKTLETVHFHEVGRDQAIANALGIGKALDVIGPDRIIASTINDGRGFVDCAHGRIPVPVPAVQAMMDACGKIYPAFQFGTCADVETEMVTPSGLASIIGIGAVPAHAASGAGAPGSESYMGGGDGGMMFMNGQITGEAEATGTRDTGRGGLRMYIIES